MRNAVGTRAAHDSFFEFSQTSRSVFFFRSVDRNTEYMFSISFRKHHDEKKKQLVNFDYQNVNSLCSPYHYVNSVR